MLKNSFFSISNLSLQEGNATAEISLNPDHEIFKGHFPDNPVTPGVCQIQMISDLLSEILKQKLFLSAAKSIKFLNVLSPGEKDLKLHLDYSPAESGYKANAILTSGEKIYLKFSGHFQTEFSQPVT